MKSVRRGYVEKDEVLFSNAQKEKILTAANDTRWLMNRGYHAESAITFTSNHYLLTARQRMAIFRSVIAENIRGVRLSKEISELGSEAFIDGLNTIITLETALSGSLILCGDDGVLRDVAGLHGTYRIIDKTAKAIDLIFEALFECGTKKATFYLDKPVSNSGSLKKLILERAKSTSISAEVELLMNPDASLKSKENVISSDGPVLQKCNSWFNLNTMIVRNKIPEAWIFNFKRDQE